MASMNVGGGAPWILGELAKLGINISETTVQPYMPKKKARTGHSSRCR